MTNAASISIPEPDDPSLDLEGIRSMWSGKWPRRLAVLSVAILLLASLIANGVLAWLVREQYRAELRVRLDPTSASTFKPRNADLTIPPHGIRRVVFAGDSRTEMWRVLPSVAGCQMINRGKSHDTSSQLLLRLDRDVLALKPDLVFLEIGANDLKSIGALSGEENTIKDRLKANLSDILDRLSRHGIPVIVSTIFPFGDVSLRRQPLWSDRIPAARQDVNQAILSLKRVGVTVFDADSVLAAHGRLRPDYQLDELHLNSKAYRVLNAVLPSLLQTAARATSPQVEAQQKAPLPRLERAGPSGE